MDIKYRKAEIQDIPLFIETRKVLLIHEGIEPFVNIDKELEDFFYHVFNNNTIYQVIGYIDNQLVATGAICIYDYPPSYTNKTGKIAYVTNMYTDINYRKKGYATHILNLLEKEANKRKIEIISL